MPKKDRYVVMRLIGGGIAFLSKVSLRDSDKKWTYYWIYSNEFSQLKCLLTKDFALQHQDNKLQTGDIYMIKYESYKQIMQEAKKLELKYKIRNL